MTSDTVTNPAPGLGQSCLLPAHARPVGGRVRVPSLRYRFIFPTSFEAGGSLFFERVHDWRRWNRHIFAECACGSRRPEAER